MSVATRLDALIGRIADALPQTQCTRCGFDDCEAYARAVASGDAGINQCPPGGAEGILRLSNLTGKPYQPLDPAYGAEGPRHVAVIDEAWCIGCTLCLAACPTDAIFGANKRMHTVIETWCTGCELCIPACPVDCIGLENITGDRTGWSAWSPVEAETARERYRLHRQRRVADAEAHAERLQKKAEMKLADLAAHSQHTDPAILDQKRRVIEAALARARARNNQGGGRDTP
ncbi:MAG: electron transport complex subunit RsxB [Burkholderiaceae bacterium]|jgi:electron transport complex protein RnfB